MFQDKFQLELSEMATMPIYKPFTESPQYQEWLKDKTSTPEKPSKEPAEQPKP